MSIVGTHANGGTLVLYEGSPDVPDTDRLWQLAQRHRVTMLGVSPTLIRTLRGRETDVAARYDLSSVHTIGSTGEPWDPDSYDWLARDVFGGRVPVINFSGGTEVGGSFLAPYPVEPIHSCSLGGPSLGMDVDVVDDAGRSLRGEQGELVCRQPWPSMTRGVWKDEERYLEAYWSTFPGMWRHGDYALVDDDGQWYIRGRSDDVMNVAGKRLAPAEVEAVLTAHPAVSEAAAVGVPDPKKGEAVWAFWVPRVDAVGDTADISAELIASVAAELGKPFAPSVVHRVSRLPKTRSAKILRRAVRAAALGTDRVTCRVPRIQRPWTRSAQWLSPTRRRECDEGPHRTVWGPRNCWMKLCCSDIQSSSGMSVRSSKSLIDSAYEWTCLLMRRTAASASLSRMALVTERCARTVISRTLSSMNPSFSVAA